MDKEQILEKFINSNKCHSIDPFEVFTNMRNAALEAMVAYSEEQNKELQAMINTLTDRCEHYVELLEERESEIKELKDKLVIAENALTVIKNWDDDMDDEWEDQGYFSNHILSKLNSNIL